MEVAGLAASAYAARLGQGQFQVDLALVGQALKSQRDSVLTILESGKPVGGTVTESRGQNLNISV